MSEAIERVSFARRHGLQYGGDRDLYQVAGYPKELGWTHYYDLYQRDAIAGAVVDMPAETTWRTTPEVVEPSAESETAFMAAWKEVVERVGVFSRLERADKLARIGRYSVLLIGTADVDTEGMALPLGSVGGPDGVLYLSAFGEKYARIDRWVTDSRDPRYGLPESYLIDLAGGISEFRGATRSLGTVQVHWSRLVHVAENLLGDEVYGRPALQRIYNALHDLAKVSASTAEAYWQRVDGFLMATIDKDARLSPGDLKKVEEDIAAIYHDLRRYIVAQGMELQRMSESEPDPMPAAKLYQQIVSAGSGIPARMLFGSETGERSSSEDQKSYLGQIQERRLSHAEPMLLRPLIDRLIEANALPAPGREGYEVVWPALFVESEQVIAETSHKAAQTAQVLTPIGGSPMDFVEIDEDRRVWLRPTGPRGELTEEELNPEPPEPPELPPNLLPDGEEEGEEEPAEPEE